MRYLNAQLLKKHIIHFKETNCRGDKQTDSCWENRTFSALRFKLDEKTWVHLDSGPSAPEFSDERANPTAAIDR